MSYQYDLADFKRYLNERNSKYRVDGLIFWQNRIPLPIDLFNRIFEEADVFIAEYVRQVSASALVFSYEDEFYELFSVPVSTLPSSKLKQRVRELAEWVGEKFKSVHELRMLALDVAEILGLEGFKLNSDEIAVSLSHQGKKYARLFMPEPVREKLTCLPQCWTIGKDNTDMFGNVIADRYNIYRSGFSDALAIIFNALLDFRILCSGRGSSLKRLNLSIVKAEGIDVRFGKTCDGSLWEPGYGKDHYVTLSAEHPLLRGKTEADTDLLIEFLYYLAEFENNQFSDTQRKLFENMRQEVSRSLWICHD